MTAPLVVAVLSPSGTVYFASVDTNARVEQVIDLLLRTTDISRQVLGDLNNKGWALQRIRRTPIGHIWTAEELEASRDGEIVPPSSHSILLLTLDPRRRLVAIALSCVCVSA
jgi:diaphanous 1